MEKKIFVVDKTNGYVPPGTGTAAFENEQKSKRMSDPKKTNVQYKHLVLNDIYQTVTETTKDLRATDKPMELKLTKETKKGEWKKMTLKKFILALLQGEPFSTEEIAKKFKEEGHSNKTVEKIKMSVSATISLLRKEGCSIHKIKAGRYGIKNTSA